MNELLGLAIDDLIVAYEKLEQIKNEGMGLYDKDKMACYLQMACIWARINLKIYTRLEIGTWPTD